MAATKTVTKPRVKTADDLIEAVDNHIAELTEEALPFLKAMAGEDLLPREEYREGVRRAAGLQAVEELRRELGELAGV